MGTGTEPQDELDVARSDDVASVHAALAAAQDKSYWLDRWQLDLNALMTRRGAGEIRAAVRVLRAVYRALYNAAYGVPRRARRLRQRAGGARRVVRQERTQATSLSTRYAVASPRRLEATPVSDLRGSRGDADDPQELVALQRADGLVDALARTGHEPAAGQRWVGFGTGAEGVLTILGDAYPGLASGIEQSDGAIDVAFVLSSWDTSESPLERVSELHSAVRPGGRLLLSGTAHTTEPLSAERVLAQCTPHWRVMLYLPGGMEGGRDLYVLERA